MGCPVALNSAIVQCVSQTYTLFKQTTPGKYSSSAYLFSLCLNVGRYVGERERQGRTLINKQWHKKRKKGNRLGRWIKFGIFQTCHANL